MDTSIDEWLPGDDYSNCQLNYCDLKNGIFWGEVTDEERQYWTQWNQEDKDETHIEETAENNITSVVTEDITSVVTEDITSVVTEDITSVVTEDITSMVTEDITSMVTEDITSVVTEDITSVVTEDITPVVTEDITLVVTEDITPVVTEDITSMVTEDITPVVTEDITLVVTEDITSVVTEVIEYILSQIETNDNQWSIVSSIESINISEMISPFISPMNNSNSKREHPLTPMIANRSHFNNKNKVMETLLEETTPKKDYELVDVTTTMVTTEDLLSPFGNPVMNSIPGSTEVDVTFSLVNLDTTMVPNRSTPLSAVKFKKRRMSTRNSSLNDSTLDFILNEINCNIEDSDEFLTNDNSFDI